MREGEIPLQHRVHKLALAVALPALALGIGACSAKSTPPGPTSATTLAKGCTTGSAPASSTTITIKNFVFLQCPDTVSPGATITVDNTDVTTHTLTATSPAGAFNTGDISPSTTKTFTAPTKPGTYYYICEIHQYMLGALVVS